MNATPRQIRLATSEDREQIIAVQRDAFGAEGAFIAGLFTEMLADASAAPLCSLVAQQQGEIVGHALFTAASIEPGGVPAQILAPLSVRQDQQGRGAGSELVSQSLDHLRAGGVQLVFVLGYPSYYQRFGFQAAGTQGFRTPHPLPSENVGAWMVKELTPGAIASSSGTVKCCDSLDKPEYWG